jgi:serine/threonine protein kinase
MFIGTEAWFAPELCFDRPERSSFSSDVWAFGCILLEIISQQIPWRSDYENSKVLVKALGKPENATIFQNICLTQKAPERLRTILCQCCAWRKAERPNFTTIANDLSAIFDTDLQNINQGTEKVLPPKPNKKKPSTSKAQSSAAAATSSEPSCTKLFSSDFDDVTKMFSSDYDDVTLSLGQFSLDHSNPKRKSSAKPKTTQSEGPSTNKDKKTYDSINDRFVYEGRSGGRYYYSSNGTKVYLKHD